MKNNILKKARFRLVDVPALLKHSYQKLLQNDPLRMGGATAFFTSFALPFILIILLQVLGLVFNPYQLRRELFEDLSSTFGKSSVDQVFTTLIAFRQLAINPVIATIGAVFLVLVSTTLLMVIKGSINQIWSIRVHSEQGFLLTILRRLQSVLIIAATGILFLISFTAEALKAFLGRGLERLSPTTAPYFTGAITYFFSLLFVTVWFGILFRLLPDAKAKWKIALTGGLVTGILFNIGKYILRLLLTSSNIGSLYGTSASVVLLLLFVFYTSLIMYYGAAFTTVWATYINRPILPRHYAASYKVTEIA